MFRCIILLYDGLSHSVYEESESEIRSSTAALAFMDLPTLGLMTSFSLFIYYIAQMTLQLEMEQLGLYEDEISNQN